MKSLERVCLQPDGEVGANEAPFCTVISAACSYLFPDAATAAAPRCPLRPAGRSTGSRGRPGQGSPAAGASETAVAVPPGSGPCRTPTDPGALQREGPAHHPPRSVQWSGPETARLPPPLAGAWSRPAPLPLPCASYSGPDRSVSPPTSPRPRRHGSGRL